LEDRDFTQVMQPAPRVVPTSVDTRRDEHLFQHPARVLWLGVGLLALFVLFAFVIPAQPLAIDRAWSELMRDIQAPALKVVALVFNYAGRGLIRALTIAAVGVVLILARRIVAVVAYGLAEGLAPLISSVTKALVDRPRPPHELVHASGASFPSGHATYAGVTCVALVLLFTQRSARWWSLAVGGIAGMAWSRTYLQAHWLSDVTAGSMLGVAVALMVFGGVCQVKGP
jgi:membrane-associated phospholipid phosphatase